MRLGIVLQARVSSTRLPGKALLPLPLGGAVTLFERVLTRATRAAALLALEIPGVAVPVIVACPDTAADDALARLAQAAGAAVWRGAEADVLARFQGAATAHHLTHLVRLTADNPALDPTSVQAAVRAHLAAGADYTLTTGLPLGGNVEVISAIALANAAAEATESDEREHVTPFLRRHPTRFRLLTVPATDFPTLASLRLTVDYAADFALQHLLYTTLEPNFGLPDIAALLAAQPWLGAVNGGMEQIQLTAAPPIVSAP